MITKEEAKRSVGVGWHRLIDEFYCKFPDSKMIQVKEKYGGLCLYHDPTTDESSDLEIDIRMRSMEICEACGAVGMGKQIRGWFYTLCTDCYNKKLNEN